MAPRGKKPKNPVVCYKDGVRMGMRPMNEWATLLGVKYTTVSNAKQRQGTVCNHYTFEDATPEEKQRYMETKSISAMAKAAREQGKSYGQLAAERYAEDMKAAREMEWKVPEKKEDESVTPKKKIKVIQHVSRMMFSEFVRLVEGHVLLDVYSRVDGKESWVATVPSDSPMLICSPADYIMDGFRILEEDTNTIRVYVKGGEA